MNDDNTTSVLARQLAERLAATDTPIVFAESCTAGLVSATLAVVPGISKWLCGSAVVYRDATKSAWLGIDEELLSRCTTVSSEVTAELASGVLQQTPEAKLAIAVTGHLGPNAPPLLDGIIFIAALWRGDLRQNLISKEVRLVSTERAERQREAAEHVIAEAINCLDSVDYSVKATDRRSDQRQ